MAVCRSIARHRTPLLNNPRSTRLLLGYFFLAENHPHLNKRIAQSSDHPSPLHAGHGRTGDAPDMSSLDQDTPLPRQGLPRAYSCVTDKI